MTTRQRASIKLFPLNYHSIRKISSPEDVENGREVYTGSALALGLLDLPADENVRDYLLEAEGKKRRRPTQVHKAIRDTLDNHPQDFSVLNSGIALVARAVEIDDKNRVANLLRPSIINGSQTQGVLRDYFEAKREAGEESFPVHVKFELIVTADDDLIAETSISRNFQNDVMTISIAGRLGQLDELERAFQKVHDKALRKSETKLSDDYVATEKLLQVITALTPPDLWPKEAERNSPNKVYTYSMKAKCLKDFQQVWQVANGKVEAPESERERCKVLYRFYLDIAGDAWEMYYRWKSHDGFKGTRLRAIERDAGSIKEVPDGIVFPILAAMSAFAVEHNGKWSIAPPQQFSEAELIRAAANAYKEIANSNPWNMGKSKACYSALFQITSIYRKIFDTADTRQSSRV